jgi:hypothetical protein
MACGYRLERGVSMVAVTSTQRPHYRLPLAAVSPARLASVHRGGCHLLADGDGTGVRVVTRSPVRRLLDATVDDLPPLLRDAYDSRLIDEENPDVTFGHRTRSGESG